ncbi:DUF2085 domain-containing protein [Rhodohalobacter mucosus]|uniref:DUF2085 domain-containing protein n=1 Tax=Rhodohalobacter mucosus TaxID=2079485 RepID=A0A316TW40_9BACT|nr:DUF2085 domain-containing protein [Rhodohalobacter mucosus]PWN08158.1 hypothetical protein DDZ15_00545 [Rhodohalobacter mucosus]
MINKGLYVGLLVSLIALVLAALGKGMWGGDSSIGFHWTERLFYGICHQIPERTFFLNEMPMAVNSRCFGIFTGLLGGWITITLLSSDMRNSKWLFRLLIIAVVIQIIDYLGNLSGWWTNTNESRFLLGFILGFSGPLNIASMFYTQPPT